MRIKTSYLISPQKTTEYETCKEEIKPIAYLDNLLTSIEPNWTDYIPRNQMRRMGKAVRIGSGAALKLIEKDKSLKKADAIIITTANGGLEDCIKFLNQIITYGDGALTPTNFVQSTPNAIAGNIAMATLNQAYNITHVNSSFSFIDGLRDADLFLYDNKEANIILGSVEEISTYNYKINELNGDYKKEKINSLSLIDSKTKGTICGEGAAYFGLDNLGEGIIIQGYDTLLSKNNTEIYDFINAFLAHNNISESEIDGLVLGCNGDVETDVIYHKLYQNNYLNSSIYTFKDLFGEHASVISHGVWYASMLMQNKPTLNSPLRKKSSNLKKVLVFNSYRGIENSIILLSI